jgi:hypothetical protein
MLACDEATVGEGDSKDRGGEVGEGCGAVGMGLPVDIPGDMPDRGVDLLQQPSVAHGFCEDGAGEGRAGLNGAQAVVSGRSPLGAVCGEAPARDERVEVRGILERPAPGRQDAGQTREVGADEPLVCGEAFTGCRRGLAQGVGGKALRRAEKGAEGLRDGAGEEAGRTWAVLLTLVLEPALGVVVRTLGAVSVAAGMVDTGLFATALALRQAVSRVTALTVLHGTAGLSVRQGQMGVACEICWRVSLAEVAHGGQGRRPGMREWRREEASAGPFCVRGRETLGVARRGCPRERWMRRRGTPAARRGVAEACLRAWRARPVLARAARRVAVRKAPWTLCRRMGKVAVGLCC